MVIGDKAVPPVQLYFLSCCPAGMEIQGGGAGRQAFEPDLFTRAKPAGRFPAPGLVWFLRLVFSIFEGSFPFFCLYCSVVIAFKREI
jgi:hypothetical protein